jgi:NADH-quinone oxidoreductase subunit E
MIQINDYYYEDLTVDTVEQLFADFKAGKDPKPGTYVARQTSAPEGIATSLTDDSLFDGSKARPLSVIPGAPQPKPPEGEAPPQAGKA